MSDFLHLNQTAGATSRSRRTSIVITLVGVVTLVAVGVSLFVITHAANAKPGPSGIAARVTNNAAEDDFARANVAGTWGVTSNTEGLPNYPWQRSLGASPYVSINGGVGDIAYTQTNGHKVAGYVATAPAQNGDTLARITFSNVGAAEGGVSLDNNTVGTQWYQADINTFLGTLELRKRLAGIMTTVTSVPFPVTPYTTYWLRVDVQVNNGVAQVNGRAWLDNTPEPTTWQVTYNDATPLAAGYPGAMGDWFQAPPAGTLTDFTSWSYAPTGLAISALRRPMRPAGSTKGSVGAARDNASWVGDTRRYAPPQRPS